MRSGDTVYHRPTKETWQVACVDGKRLYWYGWPSGYADVADCDLIEACSDKEHEASLRSWARRSCESWDDRAQVCERQLFLLVGGYIGAHI